MHFRLWVILFSWTREIGLVIGTSFNAITYSATSTLAQEGKNYLDSLNDKTKISEHGRCWKNAIAELQVGCKFLSQETQKNLALKLTDCFLQMSGHEPLNCDVLKNKCPQKLSDRAFNTYTEFYTHTHSICYFLQSQVWQEEAEKTVNKLSSTSLRVSQQLLEAERNQETLLNHQKESIFLQHDLMKNSKGIASLLQSSQQNIDSAIRDFHSSTKEQKQLLIDLFESLSSFKSWAINETSWFSSTTFFIGSIILCKPGLDQIDNKNNSVTDLLKDEPHVENVSLYSEKNLRVSRVKSVYNLRSSQIVKK
ncbi:hypothetical protein RUM44_000814 [Polyplax serrata]|uniref:Uncharacterized protein n=1 Tax=Polyplax serrata TaxID=468196 RepID=A0ABR1B939_POLSC